MDIIIFIIILLFLCNLIVYSHLDFWVNWNSFCSCHWRFDLLGVTIMWLDVLSWIYLHTNMFSMLVHLI